MAFDPHEHPKDKVQRYIDGVMGGAIVVGKWLKMAVQRHLDDLENAEERGFFFDEDIAIRACLFFPAALRHYNGEWLNQPFALSDNQAFIVWCLWGWRRIADGVRRFRRAYLTAARKWGKSSFCAGLMLLATCCDFPPEPGAENYCVATKEDQARIVFEVAKKIRARSPAVQEYTDAKTKLIKTYMQSPQPDAILMPIGSDSDTSDGFNTHLVVLDELHAWNEKVHKGLWDRMTTAGGSRRQPLVIIITTAGDDKSTIWIREDDKMCKVLEAASRGSHVGDHLFAFIARLDQGDDPFNPEVWQKANPNYPVTPKHDYLAEQADELRDDPIERRKFIRFHANLRVASNTKAIEPARWAAAMGNLSDWSTAEYIGGGVDLGGLDDLAALGQCAKFRTGENDDGSPKYRYEIKAQAWINEQSTRDLTLAPWPSWIESGELIESAIEIADIQTLLLSLDLNGVALDQANARQMLENIEQERPDFTFPMTQSFAHFNEPIKQFLRLLKDGLITIERNELLAWCASNFQVKQNNRLEYMPDKQSSEDKIDPIVAILMAFRMAFYAQPKKRSIYSEPGNL